MDWKKHGYRAGPHSFEAEEVPTDADELEEFTAGARRRIEPWLSAVFQAEHLNLLLGSGLTTAVSAAAGAVAPTMGAVKLGTTFDAEIEDHAKRGAALMHRGAPNIEDLFRSALTVLDGLLITDATKAQKMRAVLDQRIREFLQSVLAAEGQLIAAESTARARAEALLQSFLLSFASRAASRDRLHVFTTNYDRFVEHGCDLAGLRIVDRFVGALSPVFRSSRIEVDMHYNPPGIRGEPRFMEGVVRLTKLHGSIDWKYDADVAAIRRLGIPFGAASNHTDMPDRPIDTVMVYPNAAKDVETTSYPYAELFRDMAAALCRPNAVVVTYGYGFGDDHVNRVLLDMLAIPSTHLVAITYGADERLKEFCARTRPAQVSLLYGPHFGDLQSLIEHYLPKPALDYVTGRLTELLKRRPGGGPARDMPEEAAVSNEGSDELHRAPSAERELGE